MASPMLGAKMNDMSLNAEKEIQTEHRNRKNLVTEESNNDSCDEEAIKVIQMWTEHSEKKNLQYMNALRKMLVLFFSKNWPNCTKKKDVLNAFEVFLKQNKLTVNNSSHSEMYETVISIAENPWKNLFFNWKDLYSGAVTFEDEKVQNYFNSEPENIVLARVQFLQETNQDIPALSLTRASFFYHSRIAKSFENCKSNYHNSYGHATIDWYVLLLSKNRYVWFILKEMENITCCEAVEIICRLHRKHQKEMQYLILIFFILADFKEDTLNCCSRELFYLLLKFFESHDYSVEAIHFSSSKLFHSAPNPHFYVFADFANMIFQQKCYLLSIEFYIRGLTFEINVLVNCRALSLPKMHIDAVERHLSIKYEKFSKFFKDISPEIIRECMFTSFLLLPSARKLKVIRELTYTAIDCNRRNLRSSGRETIDHPLLENRITGIPNSIRSDLVIVFESIRPFDFRYERFNWHDDSMSKLENYLRSFNKKNGISHVKKKESAKHKIQSESPQLRNDEENVSTPYSTFERQFKISTNQQDKTNFLPKEMQTLMTEIEKESESVFTNTSTTLSEESVKRPMQSKTPKGIIPKKKLDTTHNVFKHQFTVDTVSEKSGNECQKANSLAKKRPLEEATDFSIAKMVNDPESTSSNNLLEIKANSTNNRASKKIKKSEAIIDVKVPSVVAENDIENMHYADDSNNKLHMEQIQSLKFSEQGKNDYILLERESGQSEIAKNVVEKMDSVSNNCVDRSITSKKSEKLLKQHEKINVLSNEQLGDFVHPCSPITGIENELMSIPKNIRIDKPIFEMRVPTVAISKNISEDVKSFDNSDKLIMEQIQPKKSQEQGRNSHTGGITCTSLERDLINQQIQFDQSKIAENVVEKMDFICSDESTFSSHSEKSLNQYEKMQFLPDDQHIAVAPENLESLTINGKSKKDVQGTNEIQNSDNVLMKFIPFSEMIVECPNISDNDACRSMKIYVKIGMDADLKPFRKVCAAKIASSCGREVKDAASVIMKVSKDTKLVERPFMLLRIPRKSLPKGGVLVSVAELTFPFIPLNKLASYTSTSAEKATFKKVFRGIIITPSLINKKNLTLIYDGDKCTAAEYVGNDGDKKIIKFPKIHTLSLSAHEDDLIKQLQNISKKMTFS
ncbi:uncharacterized protein CDAR_538111 [Caerostris darwini]|uniref:Uncharacterized protein n=1 Tax=Caerostris darwini TaxID=1538125 RepID=A0AAV4UCI0_9ARAC|nr:uncharacterized protein CDAR_538111 [Caerostris darwini]